MVFGHHVTTDQAVSEQTGDNLKTDQVNDIDHVTMDLIDQAPALVDRPAEASIENRRILRDRSKLQKPDRLTYESFLTEPQTFKEAMATPEREKWLKASDEEMQAMDDNEVWELTECPSDKTPIPNRWVYRVKLNENSEIDRFRARLVVKGYEQKEDRLQTTRYKPRNQQNQTTQ